MPNFVRTRRAMRALSLGGASLVVMAFFTACSAAQAGGARPSPVSPNSDASSPTAATAIAASPSNARAERDPATSTADASLLAFMEGHWFGAQDGVDMEELWTSPTGHALIGMHKDVKGGRMTSFEFLRIEPTPNGLVYFASPRSAPVTPFNLVELGDKRVVFENAAHDFPQRILYWLDSSGALHARIEGKLHGAPASEQWTWTKK